MKEKIQSEKQERMRICRILKRQSVSGICVSPGYQTHEQLWQIVRKLPSDFGPYGQVKRETICDCSSGCRWFHVLAGSRSRDWGVCAYQQSLRAGLLTFEHQGCLQFEDDPRWDFLETPKGRVKHFETDDEALDLESDLLALFVESTVNATNAAQKIDLEVNARFLRLRKANLANISAAAALVESKPEEAETAFRKAIADMADYARLNLEQGFSAELAREFYSGWDCHLNSKDLSALNKLTMLLKVQSRWGELIMVTAEFFVTYPETRQQGIAQQVIKRSEAAQAKQQF